MRGGDHLEEGARCRDKGLPFRSITRQERPTLVPLARELMAFEPRAGPEGKSRRTRHRHVSLRSCHFSSLEGARVSPFEWGRKERPPVAPS